MVGTWFASTVRSGSETVIMTPSIKLANTIIQIFFDLVMQVPTLFPIGVMAVSAPTVKKAIPTMRRAAPIRNDISILLGMGAIVKHSKRTIQVIGSTEEIDSFILSFNSDVCLNGSPPPFILLWVGARRQIIFC